MDQSAIKEFLTRNKRDVLVLGVDFTVAIVTEALYVRYGCPFSDEKAAMVERARTVSLDAVARLRTDAKIFVEAANNAVMAEGSRIYADAITDGYFRGVLGGA